MDFVFTDTPVFYIDSDRDFTELCAQLETEESFGLDVETSLSGNPRTLALIQVATGRGAWLCDALEIDVTPFGRVLENPDVVKIIHNAAFEKGMFRQFGFDIRNVVDTLVVSRKLRGAGCEGGHSLKSVSKRELDIEMDKTMQCSDWLARPLSREQLCYAALDAQVLVHLYAIFTRMAQAKKTARKSRPA